MEAPDLIKPVIGFRSWRIRSRKLCSWHNSQAWQPGTNEAKCNKHREPAPYKLCRCGFYSNYQLNSAQKLSDGPCMVCQIEPDNKLYNYVTGHQFSYPVLGAGLFWGQIEAYSQGVRAQYGKPVLFSTHPGCSKEHQLEIEKLAYSYQLPVVKLEELEKKALDFGEPISPELRPESSTPWGYLS